MELSIIIVSYNTKEHLKSCLKSIYELFCSGQCEVIVVDNGSTDSSTTMIKKQFPWVRLIENNKNIGYARATNQGIKFAKGEYILLLNPDTENIDHGIEKTFGFIKTNPEIQAVTCRVELPSGELDWACHRGFPTPWASLCYFLKLDRLFPRTPFFCKYHLTYLPLDSIHEIDSPSGCFFLIKRTLLDKVGLLDEDYFCYGEDVDLAFRIKKANGKIFFYPHAKIVHYKGIASGIKSHSQHISQASKRSRLLAISYFYSAMWIFYKKHYKKIYPAFISYLVYIGIKLKKMLSILKLRV
ncbi:MAG: glycosyltransferase family 2 protein [candidate division WOR-3 bacterium]|nr:glycosyltransferase family 2 protein [candidate division WOR-3 bacterium]MCX7757803.1 glycosyltransferase family 2 protein [candidate division WOR-3 bacterium]MDW7987200.1 glycosyltransferase family 2 protein [candidate division WOR-3 bacterium]